MKKYILILFYALIAAKSYGQDTIYSIAYSLVQPTVSFEDRDTANYFYIDTTQPNNLWQIGTPSKTLFNTTHSPALALVTDTLSSYPNGNISSFELVLKTNDATTFSFWHRLDTDSLADGGVIEVSIDGGATWTNILNATQLGLINFYDNSNTISSNGNKPGFTGNSGWVKSTIHGYVFNFFRFRFTFTSDNINTNKDGWMIDNFEFFCNGTGIQQAERYAPIDIYPNPTSDFVFIRSDNAIQFKTATIKDLVGKTIFTTIDPVINLSQFNSGLYFFEITTDKAKYVARVIKQ
jgi:hypothetical protein